MTDAVSTPDAGASAVADAPAITPEASESTTPVSSDDAIRAAMEKHGLAETSEKPNGTPNPDKADPKPEKVTDKPTEPKAEKPRADDGKFKGKDGDKPADAPKHEAPKAEDVSRVAAPERFSLAAKERWTKVDPEVQSEVTRAMAEMQSGIDEYRGEREAMKPFRDMAKQHNTTVEKALENYVAAERALHENPYQGLANIARQYGVDLVSFAQAIIGGQNGQPDASAQELATLRQQVYALTQNQQATSQLLADQQAERERRSYETMFAGLRADMPRFDELRPTMKQLIDAGVVTGDDDRQILSQAYAAADRLIPGQAAEPAPPAPEAHTPVEATSLSGAPSSGSDPRNAPPQNSDEAILRAMRRNGLA